MGYHAPHGESMYVSCSHGCHQDRNPPSSEPGTDYGCAYGSAVGAAGPGRVSDRKDSNSNATGRYLTIDLDDGRRVRYLHLSRATVSIGTRVSRGQKVAESGASGYGSDWYYGAHDHTTLWSCWCYNFCSTCTLDFEDHVGGSTPPPEDDMKVNSFKKELELEGGKQTIAAGKAEFLEVTNSPLNTKIVTGPNEHLSAVAYIAFEDGLGTDPDKPAVEVETVVTQRKSNGDLIDYSLGRLAVRGVDGVTRVQVPIETNLSSDDHYLRVKVHVPSGGPSATVLTAIVRGAEFNN